ncbi:MAG: HAMP domain-containing histidine kinase [Planctomycetes bacterium]|nr:HAMP domain-containing histidine kinase [Planctomycetota bacterium]MDA0948941.1 HAMP domain-containing sensor histidine kinase [Planctomycetota bacterium]
MARVRLSRGTPRTALLLYALLVVLPGAVFGGLLWRQLDQDHARQRDQAPDEVRDTSSRVATFVAGRLQDILATERQRSPLDYRPDRAELDGAGRLLVGPSPLSSVRRPTGVLGWFAHDPDLAERDRLTIFQGAGPRDGARSRELRALLEDELRRSIEEQSLRELLRAPLGGPGLALPRPSAREPISRLEERDQRLVQVPLDVAVAAFHPRETEDGRRRCAFDDLRAAASALGVDQLTLRVSPFELRFVRTADGRSCLLASRVTVVEPIEVGPGARNEAFWRCLEPLRREQAWLQGFVLDAEWIRADLIEEARRSVLNADEVLVARLQSNELQGDRWVREECVPLADLGVWFPEPEDELYYRFVVARDQGELEARQRDQLLWLGALALVMIVSVSVGLRLLLGSLRASVEQARRTENFVAAVTHELRTPIAAVRMYGEMLRDGWVAEPARQQDYLGRILAETGRLSNLVERVIDKRRLSEAPPEPEVADLAEETRQVLEESGLLAAEDVRLQVEAEPLPALLIPVGVRALVLNLVENARKYAGAADEPILVRVARVDGQPVLEVADRGPGIPASERRRVLEPFVRLGDEATRKAQGTGLGLHLVSQYCRAMRARLALEDRPGGGLLVRVRFRVS